MGAFVLRRALQSPAQSQPKPSRLAFLRVGEQTQSHFGDSSFTCLKCTCCRSVAKLCPILCNPMGCSMADLPVLHHLLEFTQTYVH